MNKQFLCGVVISIMLGCGVQHVQAQVKRCHDLDQVATIDAGQYKANEFDELDDAVETMSQSGALATQEPGRLTILARKIGIFLLLRWFDFKDRVVEAKDYCKEKFVKVYAYLFAKKQVDKKRSHGKRSA